MSQKWLIFVILLFFLIVFLFRIDIINPAHANIGSCNAGVDPKSIEPNSSGDLTFTVDNNGQSAAIVWVRFTAPSGNFSISSGSKSGWSASVSGSSVTFTGGSQAIGVATAYSVSLTTSSETAASAWTVQASDSADGSGAVTCGGNTSVSISSSSTSDTTPPSISGSVTVSVNSSSATLTWTTSEATTAVVDYGPEGTLDLSQSDTTLSTSHSVTLSGLSASTVYSYSITITDEADNNSSTNESTFTTSSSSSSSTTTTTTTTTTASTSTTAAKKDTTKPGISLTTNFSKPFAKVPAVFGTATDDTEISKIEYAIGGKNWLNVNIVAGKSVNFSFVPAIFEDGDWEVQVRATDKAGNVQTSSVYKLVLDTIPPQVGATFLSLGTLALLPDGGGHYNNYGANGAKNHPFGNWWAEYC